MSRGLQSRQRLCFSQRARFAATVHAVGGRRGPFAGPGVHDVYQASGNGMHARKRLRGSWTRLNHAGRHLIGLRRGASDAERVF